MEVVICSSREESAALTADAVGRLVVSRERPVLGVATGSSPRAVYAELRRRAATGRLDLTRTALFALDEYVGLPPGHPASYRSEIIRELADPVGIPHEHVHTPGSDGAQVESAAACFEAKIAAAGGVDLQLLGIGANGHLAFNEPGSSLASRTRIKTLTEQTRRDNARFFDGEVSAVPRHCLTQGLGTILEAGHLVLLAQGEAKAHAVRVLVEGGVSSRWPATVLQLHPHASVLVDEAAAAELELADYYRYAWQHRPEGHHL